jgi:hypothetical protein
MRRRPYGALLESTLAVIGDAMPSKTVTIPLETAKLIRGAFLPANPNKLRAAAPEVVKAAKDFIAAVEQPTLETPVARCSHGVPIDPAIPCERCGQSPMTTCAKCGEVVNVIGINPGGWIDVEAHKCHVNYP